MLSTDFSSIFFREKVSPALLQEQSIQKYHRFNRFFLYLLFFIHEGDQYRLLLYNFNVHHQYFCAIFNLFCGCLVTDAWHSLSCSCSGFLQNFCSQQLQLSADLVGSQWISKTEEMLTCWVLSLLALKNRMRHWILLYSLQIWTCYCKVIQQIIIWALLQYPLSAILFDFLSQQ